MDDHGSLVDVLLLSDCDLYKRYPELVQRVDYFLHDWSEALLARTEALLRRQSRGLRNSEATKERSSTDDEAFTHTRSLNIVWRQWAVSRLQQPQYPPERINWNKDADPVFLYGQVPALRLGVPWSVHSVDSQPRAAQRSSPQGAQLKSALKRPDLQTFLTSPTLSPAASPLHSPLYSPAMSIRETLSTSSFSSDETLENDALRPRLRFNDRVEQCMVVFDQEKEYLPTDYEDMSDDDARSRVTAKHTHRRTASSGRARPRARRSLVIRLAPTLLKGDHRNMAVEPSRFADDDDDPFGDYDDGFAMFGDMPAQRGAGVGSYVHGYVQSMAGQVRRLVSDAASSFGKERAARPAEIVSDPFASHHRQAYANSAAFSPSHVSAGANSAAFSPSHVTADAPSPAFSSSHVSAGARGASDVVRDPFSAAIAPKSAPCDHVPFDDDEDAIIQEFEREMLKCGANAPFAASEAASEWGEDDYDMYESEFQLHMDENDADCYAEYRDSRVSRPPPTFSAYRAGSASSMSLVKDHAASVPGSAAPTQLRNARNESIIDRAEDTIVNTVDAVKWCASFISNYTIF
ncbi:protein phosphatase regulator [Coemansia sp. RSA 2618]|nr:protein phosphatase regulator [Coemansia sp. RSA 2618]